MASVVLTLDVTVDGISLFGAGPLVRRREVEALADVTYVKADDGDATTFVAHPALAAFASLGFVVLRPSRAVTVRVNGQTDTGIPLAADGVLLILDTTMATATLLAVNNDGDGATAILETVLGGTAP